MRFALIPAILILLVNAGVDLCIYRIIRAHTEKRKWADLYMWSSVILALVVLAVCIIPKRSGDNGTFLTVMWLLYGYLSIYIPKYIYLLFHGISLLPRVFHKKAVKPLSVAGLVLAFVVFVLMWWGVFNRNNLQIKELELNFTELPQAFKGYRIVQISDLHTGTFSGDTMFLHRLVETINNLEPDLIVFTGDIVNRRSIELKPYTSTLSRLKAADGVYSILGNHDYGDYFDWDDEQSHDSDVENLKRMETSMGWKMLNNSHAILHKGNDSIALLGVENIGDPPFRIYGFLADAYPDVSDETFKILLSHNPAHWDGEIQNTPAANIALTLSGHTHAMQTELFGFSPSCFRYPHWGGLYEDSCGHKLYVNIGAGTVGFPARIGATPEITLITLSN